MTLQEQAQETLMAYGYYSEEYKLFCIENGLDWGNHYEEEETEEWAIQEAEKEVEQLKKQNAYIKWNEGCPTQYHLASSLNWYVSKNQERWQKLQTLRKASKIVDSILRDYAWWSKQEQRNNGYPAIVEV